MNNRVQISQEDWLKLQEEIASLHALISEQADCITELNNRADRWSNAAQEQAAQSDAEESEELEHNHAAEAQEAIYVPDCDQRWYQCDEFDGPEYDPDEVSQEEIDRIEEQDACKQSDAMWRGY